MYATLGSQVVLADKEGRPDEAEYMIYRTQLDDVLLRQQKLLDQHLGEVMGKEQFKRMNHTLLDEEAQLREKVKHLEREAVADDSHGAT